MRVQKESDQHELKHFSKMLWLRCQPRFRTGSTEKANQRHPDCPLSVRVRVGVRVKGRHTPHEFALNFHRLEVFADENKLAGAVLS